MSSLLDSLSSGSSLLPHLELTLYKCSETRGEFGGKVLSAASEITGFLEYKNKQIKLQNGTDYMSDTQVQSFDTLAEGDFLFFEAPGDVNNEIQNARRIKAVKASKSSTNTIYEAYL